MAKTLVVVESPAKIKTLKSFLGSNYIFESSYGHIRDLPESEFGIDIEKEFEPKYTVLSDKKKVVAQLKKAAKECDQVLLAPDPDREGEAIAWHILNLLPEKTKIGRISFNSLTKDAVLEAVDHPGQIDMALVNAQQARRLLDRLVGYTISPLLNQRLHRPRGKAVSAGRVQSVALKLIVDREKEIEAFIPKEYWNIFADLQHDALPPPFNAYLYSIDGNKVEKEALLNRQDFVLIDNKNKAEDIVEALKDAKFKVASVEKKEKRRNPEAPFITSTLQQEASRHFRFSPAKTMQIAQSLYEGVELGKDGAEGLITYMRTDSVRLAPIAIQEARQFIQNEYGDQFLPDSPRSYQVKKSAQDAHEAIRPTHVGHHPEKIKQYLSPDQYLLYTLIWKRFIACQMTSAIYDTVSCDIEANSRFIFRATGSILKFAGFLILYEEKNDEIENAQEMRLPPLQGGEILNLLALHHDQSFTKPPPRYTEASLIRELERSGIGRPSTYAAIMNKIQSRDYTLKEKGRLKPTELGCIITEMLVMNFNKIVDTGFTALMEDELELVAESKKDWKALLKQFWNDFFPTLELAKKTAKVPKIETNLICPKCGKSLQKVWSKSKYFLGCINYPECDYTSSIEEASFDKSLYKEDFQWEQKCSKCGADMKLRFGRFGPFLGCSGFPDCRSIVAIPKKEDEVAAPCPAIGCTGTLMKRRSRYGKPFYSCSEYPNCDVIGQDPEAVQEKYVDHPKTPYQKTKSTGKHHFKAKKAKKPTKKSSKKKVKE